MVRELLYEGIGCGVGMRMLHISVQTGPDYSKVVNENCGAVRTAEFQTVEIIARNDSNAVSRLFSLPEFHPQRCFPGSARL